MNHPILLFFSGPDIAIIVVVVLVLFGGKKIPELARGLGKGIREFKETQKEPGTTDDAKTDRKV